MSVVYNLDRKIVMQRNSIHNCTSKITRGGKTEKALRDSSREALFQWTCLGLRKDEEEKWESVGLCLDQVMVKAKEDEERLTERETLIVMLKVFKNCYKNYTGESGDTSLPRLYV